MNKQNESEFAKWYADMTEDNIFVSVSLQDLPVFANNKTKLIAYFVHWSFLQKRLIYVEKNTFGDNTVKNKGTVLLKCVKSDCKFVARFSRHTLEHIIGPSSGNSIPIPYWYVSECTDHNCDPLSKSESLLLKQGINAWRSCTTNDTYTCQRFRNKSPNTLLLEYIRYLKEGGRNDSLTYCRCQICPMHDLCQKIFKIFQHDSLIFSPVTNNINRYYIYLINPKYLEGDKVDAIDRLANAFKSLLSFHPNSVSESGDNDDPNSPGFRALLRSFLSKVKNYYMSNEDLIGTIFSIFLLISQKRPDTSFSIRYLSIPENIISRYKESLTTLMRETLEESSTHQDSSTQASSLSESSSEPPLDVMSNLLLHVFEPNPNDKLSTDDISYLDTVSDKSKHIYEEYKKQEVIINEDGTFFCDMKSLDDKKREQTEALRLELEFEEQHEMEVQSKIWCRYLRAFKHTYDYRVRVIDHFDGSISSLEPPLTENNPSYVEDPNLPILPSIIEINNCLGLTQEEKNILINYNNRNDCSKSPTTGSQQSFTNEDDLTDETAKQFQNQESSYYDYL